MVDLSNLKPGDTVHFRCGGKAVVTRVNIHTPPWNIVVAFVGSNAGERYRQDGNYFVPATHPFDIIRVEPAFRWEDVRPGMAFEARDKALSARIWFYLSPTVDPLQILATTDGRLGAGGAIESTISSWSKTDLTRAPEHDIEVAK